MKILITGATGFIGSNIAEFLTNNGHSLIATKRTNSNMDRCVSFLNSVEWVDTNERNWQDTVITFKPEILVHTAWSGVNAQTRDNIETQLLNIAFLNQLLEIADKVNIKKIISLGSQAEYGIFTNMATENNALNPVDNYGKIKLEALKLLTGYCNKVGVEWYWLRVFSVLGTNENPEWLVPYTITKLINGDDIQLTMGEQRYDYLYMDDFLERFNKVINHTTNDSGVYNLCSGRAIEIKELLICIANALKVNLEQLKFGALPYRVNQNMNIVGSPELFDKTFGKSSLESLNTSINRIIKHYNNK